MTPKGGTGVGNALLKATEILADQSDDNHQKAIILFTDGSDFFGKDELGLARCQENEASATLWAKKNNCPIYCFGYDYRTANGVSSMGENGEGLKKLTSISQTTGGSFTRIQDINTVQEEFIRILADLCDLIYVNVDTVPGDGGVHEVTFEVNPSVIEANIRIGSITENAISKGKISLYDPSGKQIELANKGNIRFDVDSLAASIKVIRPKLGTWTLVLDGIVGDNVKIGLLQHYRVGIDTSIELPSGNPLGVAFLNDRIRVNAWFVEDGAKIENPNLYDIVTNATLTYIPRANPQNGKTIKLTKNGLSFSGDFTIEEECIYDVVIRIESGSFFRECTLMIKSSNQPLELVSDIEKVDVNLNKSVNIDDIYAHVRDLEGDTIIAEASVKDPDAVDVSINGNSLNVHAKKWHSTMVTVTYKDAQGNTVETSFKIQVHNPWFFIVMGIIIALIILAVVILTRLAYRASLKIKGDLYLTEIEVVDYLEGNGEIYLRDFTEDDVDRIETQKKSISISMGVFYKRKNMRSIEGIIRETISFFQHAEFDTEDYKTFQALSSNTSNTLMVGADKCRILGTPSGASFSIKPSKKATYLTVNRSKNTVVVKNGKKIEICFKDKKNNYDSDQSYVILKYYFTTPIREIKKK